MYFLKNCQNLRFFAFLASKWDLENRSSPVIPRVSGFAQNLFCILIRRDKTIFYKY